MQVKTDGVEAVAKGDSVRVLTLGMRIQRKEWGIPLPVAAQTKYALNPGAIAFVELTCVHSPS